MMRSVAVVIPALNAEATVGPVVERCRALVQYVFVVDDGSSDTTGVEAAEHGARVIRHEENRGKGAALRTGFQAALDAGCSAVITLDADGQHLPEEIPRFIEAWERPGADLVIGSRRHLFPQMVRRRRNANRFSAWALSVTSGTSIPDSQSGYRLYSQRLLRESPFQANGFDAESEIIVRAGRKGFRIESIPIGLGFVNGLGTTHYRAIADTLRIAWRVLRVRLLG